MRGNTPDRRWGAEGLRVCLIVEELYGSISLPLEVGDHLRGQGHSVTVLEPHATATYPDRYSYLDSHIYRDGSTHGNTYSERL